MRQQPDAVRQPGAGLAQLGIVEPGEVPRAGPGRGDRQPGEQHVRDHVPSAGPAHGRRRRPWSTISITVSQAAGSRSAVAAITMPATGTGGRGRPERRGATARAAFSRSRAGERVPPVSTSESSTTRAVPCRRARGQLAQHARRSGRAECASHWPVPVRQPACAAATCTSPTPAPGPGRRTPPTVRSAGPWWTAAWQSRPRAAASAAVRSPAMPTTPPSERSTSTGAASSRARRPAPARRRAACRRRSHRRCPGAVGHARVQVQEVVVLGAAAPTAGCWAAPPGAAPRRGPAPAGAAGSRSISPPAASRSVNSAQLRLERSGGSPRPPCGCGAATRGRCRCRSAGTAGRTARTAGPG